MPSTPASLHYIVAATPRSGSTLLCELLKGTGIAGQPNEDFQALRSTSQSRQPRQYFEGVDGDFVDRLAPTDPGEPETDAEFAAALEASFAASTTPNGVYGTKVMWGYFDLLAQRLATLPGLADASLPEALEATFPNLHFIQIQRQDKVGQAISLWTAVQTRTWRDEGEGPAHAAEPFYDFAAIDHLVKLQTSHEDAWTDWLGRHDFPTRTVVYEDFVADDPRTEVADVARWLGVPGADELRVPEPKMRRQGNGRSKEWADRYRDEAGAGAAPGSGGR
ncbi:MAG: Stf0 family sulfotransferase [Patulibacter minatonensis]